MEHHLETVKTTIQHVMWSLILQGAIFILLAILIVIYPALLIALVATMFLFMGLMLIGFAVRLRTLWGKLPGFLK